MNTAFGGTQCCNGVFAVTTLTGQRLVLCPQVIERSYQERVKPHLTPIEAAQDLAWLIAPPRVGSRQAVSDALPAAA